ncbi:hypothetical protein HMPREF0262_00409 [Clostridium sp. ATCC 29733]|nr:hypothetical protein HMPREF0262_00409 [Clostridium sp. ATCC 29733]
MKGAAEGRRRRPPWTPSAFARGEGRGAKGPPLPREMAAKCRLPPSADKKGSNLPLRANCSPANRIAVEPPCRGQEIRRCGCRSR